jgi:hypothetical protein
MRIPVKDRTGLQKLIFHKKGTIEMLLHLT